MHRQVSRTMLITMVVVAGVVFFIVEHGSPRIGGGARWVGTVLLGKLSERHKGFDPDVA